jgi:hypothetical protein
MPCLAAGEERQRKLLARHDLEPIPSLRSVIVVCAVMLPYGNTKRDFAWRKRHAQV